MEWVVLILMCIAVLPYSLLFILSIGEYLTEAILYLIKHWVDAWKDLLGW